ncbi:MAG: hypothetical protein N2712_01950 [Brevinematales bacterium]|nr:hypothetical protein [Brevinematales bacterium]
MFKWKLAVVILSILLVIQTVLFISFSLYYNDRNLKKFIDEIILPKKEKLTTNDIMQINEIFSYRVYGDISDDNLYYSKFVKDKFYFLGGRVSKNGFNDIWFFNVDRDGSIVSNMMLGKDKYDEVGLSLDVYKDFVYITSELQNPGRNINGVWILKLTNMVPEWDILIRTASKSVSPICKVLKSGDVILSFSTTSLISNILSLVVIRVSKSGDFRKALVISGTLKETPVRIVEFNSGKYWIIGESKSFGFGETDIFIVSFATNDEIEWFKVYGTKFAETPNYVLQLDDGVIVTTSARHFSAIKIDTNGNIIWTKIYKNGSISSIFKFQDSLFATGTIFDPYSYKNIFVFEADYNLNIKWEEFYSFSYDEMPYEIFVETNFIYVLGTMYNDKTQRDVWFVKLKRMTNLVMSNSISNVQEYSGEILVKDVSDFTFTNILISSTNDSIFEISSIYNLPSSISERFKIEREVKRKTDKKKSTGRKKK